MGTAAGGLGPGQWRPAPPSHKDNITKRLDAASGGEPSPPPTPNTQLPQMKKKNRVSVRTKTQDAVLSGPRSESCDSGSSQDPRLECCCYHCIPVVLARQAAAGPTAEAAGSARLPWADRKSQRIRVNSLKEGEQMKAEKDKV